MLRGSGSLGIYRELANPSAGGRLFDHRSSSPPHLAALLLPPLILRAAPPQALPQLPGLGGGQVGMEAVVPRGCHGRVDDCGDAARAWEVGMRGPWRVRSRRGCCTVHAPEDVHAWGVGKRGWQEQGSAASPPTGRTQEGGPAHALLGPHREPSCPTPSATSAHLTSTTFWSAVTPRSQLFTMMWCSWGASIPAASKPTCRCMKLQAGAPGESRAGCARGCRGLHRVGWAWGCSRVHRAQPTTVTARSRAQAEPAGSAGACINGSHQRWRAHRLRRRRPGAERHALHSLPPLGRHGLGGQQPQRGLPKAVGHHCLARSDLAPASKPHPCRWAVAVGSQARRV